MKTLQLPSSVEQELAELKKTIREILGDHLKQIILFGSYARHEANDESDIDIMVLTDLEGEELKAQQNMIRNKCADLFSIQCVTINYFLKGANMCLFT